MVSNPHAAASVMAFKAALKVAGHDATYSRGADSVPLRVVPGRQDQLQQGRADGAGVSGSFANFEMLACCLVINGETILPAKGDVLTVDFFGVEKTFQAVQGLNNRAFDYADNHHQILTVHFSGRD